MSSPFSPVRYLTKVGAAGFCEKLLWPVAKQSCLSSSALPLLILRLDAAQPAAPQRLQFALRRGSLIERV